MSLHKSQGQARTRKVIVIRGLIIPLHEIVCFLVVALKHKALTSDIVPKKIIIINAYAYLNHQR